jgi:hypothetical protein
MHARLPGAPSPLTLLGCCGGGKGVYSFFFFLAVASASGPRRVGAFCFLNLGRKRSHDSFLSVSSLASSRLMSSS